MAQIAAIYAPLVETSVITFELDVPDAADMTRRWRALVEGGYAYLVALDDGGSVSGYAYCGAFRTRAAYRHCVETSVYVHPKAQGSGVGKALMEALMSASKASGFTQMIAVVTDAPETQYSLAFHAALGFETVGTLTKAGRKFDRWLDVTLLQKPL